MNFEQLSLEKLAFFALTKVKMIVQKDFKLYKNSVFFLHHKDLLLEAPAAN